MDTGYGNPDFLRGVTDPLVKKEDPTQRSWGELATDIGTKLIVDPALSVARGATTVGHELEGNESGTWAGYDRAVGQAQEWARTDALSPYQRQTDQSQFFNSDPDVPSAWRRPIGAITSQFLPSVLGLAGVALAAPVVGPALAAGIGTGAAVGFGATEMVGQMRDLADRTPLTELRKSPVFNQAMIDNNGDERAARHQFFKDTADTWGVVANALANGLEFGVMAKYLPSSKKALAGRMWRAAGGFAEGAGSGFVEGAAGEYGEQSQRLNAGLQDRYNLTDIVAAGGEAAAAFGPAVGVLKALQRGPKAASDAGNSGQGTDVENTAALMLGAPSRQLALPAPDPPGPPQALLTGPPQGLLTDQRFNLGERGPPGTGTAGHPGAAPALPLDAPMPGQEVPVNAPPLDAGLIPASHRLGAPAIPMGDQSEQAIQLGQQPAPGMPADRQRALTGPVVMPPSRQLAAPLLGLPGRVALPAPDPAIPMGGPTQPGPTIPGSDQTGDIVLPEGPVGALSPGAAAISTGLPPPPDEGGGLPAVPPAPLQPPPQGGGGAAIDTGLPPITVTPTVGMPTDGQGITMPVAAARPAQQDPSTPPSSPGAPAQQLFITEEQAEAIDQAIEAGGPAQIVQQGNVVALVQNGQIVQSTVAEASTEPLPGTQQLVITSPSNFDILPSTAPPDPALKRMVDNILAMKNGDAMVFDNGTWWQLVGRSLDGLTILGSNDPEPRTVGVEAAAKAALKYDGHIESREKFERLLKSRRPTPEVKTPAGTPKLNESTVGPMPQGTAAERAQRVESVVPETRRPGQIVTSNVVQTAKEVARKAAIQEGTKATAEQGKLREDIRQFALDEKHGVAAKPPKPAVDYYATKEERDRGIESTGIYARGPGGGYVIGSTGSLAGEVKAPALRKMTDDEFNRRRNELLKRAKAADEALIAAGGNPIFERSLPPKRAAKPRAANPAKQFTLITNHLNNFLNLSDEEFGETPEVIAAVIQLYRINRALIDADKSTLPIPVEIFNKLTRGKELRDKRRPANADEKPYRGFNEPEQGDRADADTLKAYRQIDAEQARYMATAKAAAAARPPLDSIDVTDLSRTLVRSDLADQKADPNIRKDAAALDDEEPLEMTGRLLTEAAIKQNELEKTAKATAEAKAERQQKAPPQATPVSEAGKRRREQATAIQQRMEARRKEEQPTLLANKEVDPLTGEPVVKAKSLLRRYLSRLKENIAAAANAPKSIFDLEAVLNAGMKKLKRNLSNAKTNLKATDSHYEKREQMMRKIEVDNIAAVYGDQRDAAGNAIPPEDAYRQVLFKIYRHAGRIFPDRPKSLTGGKKRHAKRGETDTQLVSQEEDRAGGETAQEAKDRIQHAKEVQAYLRSQLEAFRIAKAELLPYLQKTIGEINAAGLEHDNLLKPTRMSYQLPMSERKKGYMRKFTIKVNTEKMDYNNYAIEMLKAEARIMQIDDLLSGKTEAQIMRELNNRRSLIPKALHAFSLEMSSFLDDSHDFLRDRMAEIRSRRNADSNLYGLEVGMVRAEDVVDEEGHVIAAADINKPVLQDVTPSLAEQLDNAETVSEQQKIIARVMRETGSQSAMRPSKKRMKTPGPTVEMLEIPIKWSTPEAQDRYNEWLAKQKKDKRAFSDTVIDTEFEPVGTEESRAKALEDLQFDDDPTGVNISEAMTANDLIEQVRQLIRDGKTGMSSFVTEEFLDRLSSLIAHETHVYNTIGMPNIGAWYDPDRDRIVLPADISDFLRAQIAMHELVHAGTERLLHTDDKFYDDVNRLYLIAKDALAARGIDIKSAYGLTNPSEFIAESRSNAEFRDLIDGIPSRGLPVVQPGKQKHSVLNSLYRVIQKAWHKVFGPKDGDTALDAFYASQSTVLGDIDRYLNEAIDRQVAAGGRGWKDYEPRYEPTGIDKRAAFKIMDNLGSYAKEKLDRGIAQYKKGLGERGFAMPLKSTFDITQEGDLTLQQKAGAIHDVMSKEFAERGRIIREQDDPILNETITWYRKLSEGARNEVGGFMFDETFHYAFGDATLDSKRNAHLHDKHGRFVRTLDNEQIAQNHQDMMDRYKKAAKIAGFVKHRAAMHKFFQERENEIRDTVSRTYLYNSDVIPETYKGKARMAVAEELRRWTFQTSQGGAQRAYRSLLAKGIDVLEPGVRDDLREIRDTDAFRRIPGPYMPLTRRGEYAVAGTYNFPLAFGAQRPPQEVHWETKKPIDDGTYLFNNDMDARKYVKHITDNFGASQIKGGVYYYDVRTGQRMRVMTDEEAEVAQELQTAGVKVRNRMLTAKQAEARIANGDPNIRKKYFVQFQNKVLEFHPGEFEADRNHREWQAKADAWKKKFGSDVLDLTRPGDIRKGDPRQNEKYVSAEFQRMIDRFENSRAYRNMDSEEQRASKYALTLAAAKSTMHRGVRQRFQPRGYVQGASHDLPAAMSEYSAQTAGYLAKMKFQPEANDATRELDDYVESKGQAKNYLHIQRVANEMKRRLHTPTENHLDTVWGRATDRLLKITMFDKLMGAAYLAINATEPIAIAAPLLVGRHPPLSIILQMQRAYRLAGPMDFANFARKDVWNVMKGKVDYTQYAKEFRRKVSGQSDGANLNRMLNEIAMRGLFEAAAGIEVQRTFLAPDNKFDRALEWGSNVFQGANTAVENLNRFVTAVATYRLEMAKHNDHDLAVKNTVKLMYKANGQYANFNSPTLFNAGPIGRMAFQFKKYPQRMIMNYYRAIAGTFIRMPEGLNEAEQKEWKQTRVENARTLVAMLVMQGMAAGLLGMPTEPFSIPLNAMYIAGLSPYNWDDAQAAIRQSLSKTFGNDLAELIAHGASRLTGVDASSRLGQESMLTRGSPSDPKNYPTAILGLVFGASGSTLLDFMAGVGDIGKGISASRNGADDVAFRSIREGVKKLMPVRAFSDTVDMIAKSEPEGMQTRSGRQMRQPYTLGERIVKGIGFTPTREAESMEARRDVDRAKYVYNKEKERWRDLWVQSSPAQQGQLFPRIQAWNARQEPGMGLTYSQLRRAGTTRSKSEQQDPAMLGLSLNKETMPLLRRAQAYNS